MSTSCSIVTGGFCPSTLPSSARPAAALTPITTPSTSRSTRYRVHGPVGVSTTTCEYGLDQGAVGQGGHLAVVDVVRAQVDVLLGADAAPAAGEEVHRDAFTRGDRDPPMPTRVSGLCSSAGDPQPLTSVIVAPGSTALTAACSASPAAGKGCSTSCPSSALRLGPPCPWSPLGLAPLPGSAWTVVVPGVAAFPLPSPVSAKAWLADTAPAPSSASVASEMPTRRVRFGLVLSCSRTSAHELPRLLVVCFVRVGTSFRRTGLAMRCAASPG